MPADHENMTKFSRPYDVGFIRISAAFSRWIDEIKNKRVALTSQHDDFIPLTEHLDKLVRHDHATSEKPVAKAWLNSYGGVLNIIGPRGCGKTLYAASLIDALTRTSTGNSVVGFAFCRSLAPSTVLRSLIWQICQSDSMTAQQKSQMLKAYGEFPVREMGHKPKEEQEILVFRKIYEDMLRSYDHVTLVFDAVDQSGSPDRLVRLASSLASQLFNLNVQSRVLITSQQEIAWPETADHGLSSTVLSITREDLAIDIENFRRVLAGEATSSGWPYTMHTMAKEYMRCQRYKEAQIMEEAVMEYRQERFPDDSVPSIECKRILAVTLSEQGQLKKAEELQRNLLETYRHKQYSQDDLYVQLVNDLGLTLSSSETWEEAKEIQIQLVGILEEKGGESEAMLKGVENNLALTYASLGLLDEAEHILRRCFGRVTESEGADSEAACDAKCNLGQILARKEKWAEAEELEVDALETRKQTLGMENLKTLQSISNVGWALAQQRQFERAKELQLQVLAGRTKLQGVNHPQTLAICGNLAWTVSQLGERDEARRYARLALGYD
ncbi:MAG: hypothetical protein LQ337_002196 [Flavoplaca oasis]|nr:MAG: hypothetical protein LQ337_002196 [Flavoplaca oasis]